MIYSLSDSVDSLGNTMARNKPVTAQKAESRLLEIMTVIDKHMNLNDNKDDQP